MSTETEGEGLDSQMETYEPLEEGSENKQHYEEGVGTLSENEEEPFVFAEDVETEFNEGGIGETGDICRGMWWF